MGLAGKGVMRGMGDDPKAMGGAGRDVFLFGMGGGGQSVDHITDSGAAQDRIGLDASVIGRLVSADLAVEGSGQGWAGWWSGADQGAGAAQRGGGAIHLGQEGAAPDELRQQTDGPAVKRRNFV